MSRTRLRGVTLIALLAVLFYAATVGPSSIFATRDILDARRRSAFGDPTVAVIASTLAIYVPLLVAQARRWLPIEDVQPHSLENRCATVTFAAITVIVANPVGNARYVSGTILLSMLFLSGAFGNVRRSRWSFWIVIAGFIFVFPLFNSFRRGTGGLSRNGFFGEYAGNGDYDAFYQIGNAISYVAARGADDGLQLLGVLLFWVPRSVWSSKPLDTGTLLANFRGYSFGNLSAPIWAEFLVNFGLAGLFAGIFFVGFVISRADVFLGGLASENSIAVFRNSVIPFYLFIILRGSLLQAMAGLVTLVVFTYVLLPRHRLAHRV